MVGRLVNVQSNQSTSPHVGHAAVQLVHIGLCLVGEPQSKVGEVLRRQPGMVLEQVLGDHLRVDLRPVQLPNLLQKGVHDVHVGRQEEGERPPALDDRQTL